MTRLILFALLVVAVVSFLRKLGVGQRPLPGQPNGVTTGNWSQLVTLCRGDQSLALRLFAAEKDRAGQLSEDEACRMAHWRLLRDRE